MTVHCLVLENPNGRIGRLTAYSSEKKRNEATKFRQGSYLKFSVPDMDRLREFLVSETAKHGGSVSYSQPQRRSIAWGEIGIRLNAVCTYPVCRLTTEAEQVG